MNGKKINFGKGVKLKGNSIVYEEDVPRGQVKVKKKLKKKTPLDVTLTQHILGTDLQLDKKLFQPESPLILQAQKEFNVGPANVHLSGVMGEGKSSDEVGVTIKIRFKKGGKV